MQVTRQNYQESFKTFSEVINSPKTDFIAYDFEMTGIRTTEKESYNDTPFERYDKCAQVGRKYALIQAGITIVHKEGDQYICYPFNAYIIRRKIENTSYKPDVILESGAVRFNAEHGCDFDYWIKNGISFLDREQHRNLINEVQKRQDINDVEKKNILNNIEESLGFTKFFELIGQRNVPIVGHNCYMDLLFLHNSFIGTLPKYYSKKFSIEEDDDSQKESTEGSDSQQEEKKEGEAGSQNTFKENIFNTFGLIYDSKVLSVSFFKDFMTEESKSTSLESLKGFIYSNLEKYRLANVQLAPGCYQDYDWDSPSNEQKFHEAGFDSYLTAWIFLQLRSFYLINLNKTLKDFENAYLNKVNVMNNRFFLTFGSDEDIVQTQIMNGNLSDDILYVFTHPDHNDPNREVDNEAVEKLQKQILEYVIAEKYTSFVRVSIMNSKYIFIELSLQNNKNQEDINNLKKKIEDDIQNISKMATQITYKEYEQQVFFKKYSKNHGKKSNNNNNNNNNSGSNNSNSGKGKPYKPYNKK